jgi:hypothetical protein
VEGEVLVLPNSITKALSITAFFGLTLAPVDGPGGGVAPPSGTTPQTPVTPVVQTPAATASSAPAPDPIDPVCGRGMILVAGEYCPDVDQKCLHWLDAPPYDNLRCGEFEKPAKCKVPKQARRFCIDREEYAEASPTNDPGDALPVVHKNWAEAKQICETRGARLCKEAEWELACEGPEMSPYPYGWKRDSTVCNFDRTDLGGMEEKLIDHRAKLSEFPQCKSPFGVHNMVGNVDEWAEREGQVTPNRGALRGGWWLPGRNRCRAATREHKEDYHGKQVGFRCCKDAP